MCPICNSKNIGFHTVEIWNVAVVYKYDEILDKMIQVASTELGKDEEVYDSRRIKCNNCNWEDNISNVSEELKQVFNSLD